MSKHIRKLVPVSFKYSEMIAKAASGEALKIANLVRLEPSDEGFKDGIYLPAHFVTINEAKRLLRSKRIMVSTVQYRDGDILRSFIPPSGFVRVKETVPRVDSMDQVRSISVLLDKSCVPEELPEFADFDMHFEITFPMRMTHSTRCINGFVATVPYALAKYLETRPAAAMPKLAKIHLAFNPGPSLNAY